MDGFDCTGSEESLVDCMTASWGSHDCGHGEDAGVICGEFILNSLDDIWCKRPASSFL
jgi:deleted-in-malignant-brain-tumors protein 1